MDPLKRTARTLLGGAIGAGVGGVATWMFFAIWTSMFGGVPLKYAWTRVQQQPSTNLLGTALVVAGTLLGLGIGLAWGLRGGRDSS